MCGFLVWGEKAGWSHKSHLYCLWNNKPKEPWTCCAHAGGAEVTKSIDLDILPPPSCAGWESLFWTILNHKILNQLLSNDHHRKSSLPCLLDFLCTSLEGNFHQLILDSEESNPPRSSLLHYFELFILLSIQCSWKIPLLLLQAFSVNPSHMLFSEEATLSLFKDLQKQHECIQACCKVQRRMDAWLWRSRTCLWC